MEYKNIKAANGFSSLYAVINTGALLSTWALGIPQY